MDVGPIMPGSWVLVHGDRIGRYDFVGLLLGAVQYDDHLHYDVLDYVSGDVINCCDSLLEVVQTATSTAERYFNAPLRHSPFKSQ